MYAIKGTFLDRVRAREREKKGKMHPNAANFDIKNNLPLKYDENNDSSSLVSSLGVTVVIVCNIYCPLRICSLLLISA
jgi:hypothetical protein